MITPDPRLDPTNKIVATYESNTLSSVTYVPEDALRSINWWTDGPRSDEEEFETLAEALIAFSDVVRNEVEMWREEMVP